MTPPPLAEVDMAAATAALAEVVPRLTAMMRSVTEPTAPAMGDWNLADVAIHLDQAWDVVPSLSRREMKAPLKDVWELAQLTSSVVAGAAVRDLGVLADRIDARAAVFLEAVAGADPDETGPWLVEGVAAPMRLYVCHLLNESLVHGYDIAHAAGLPWPMAPAHAAMALLGFVFPSIAAVAPRAMVDQGEAAGLRATFDIRLRRGGRAYFVFDDGALSIEGPSSRTVDCHLSADPAGLLLVAWGRKSQWPAIARGQLLAWGRRPWLGVRLRSLMRNP